MANINSFLSCGCLPTPMVLDSGGSTFFPLVVHQPVSLAICAVTLQAGSVHKFNGDNVACMWVKLKKWCVLYMRVLQRGHGGDGCDLTSTLCKYNLRKSDLFIRSWARVRRVRRGSNSSELLLCALFCYWLVCETWLNCEATNYVYTNALLPPGYTIYHVDIANEATGGGVAIIHRQCLNIKLCVNIKFTQF